MDFVTHMSEFMARIAGLVPGAPRVVRCRVRCSLSVRGACRQPSEARVLEAVVGEGNSMGSGSSTAWIPTMPLTTWVT